MMRQKQDWELTIQERIDRAGWFKGTEREWQSLPTEEKNRLAMSSVRCLHSYPTWQIGSVNCCHMDCRIARGERRPIHMLNGALLSEARDGWWRDIPRDRLAKMFRAYRKAARASNVYDHWKIGGVHVALSGLGV